MPQGTELLEGKQGKVDKQGKGDKQGKVDKQGGEGFHVLACRLCLLNLAMISEGRRGDNLHACNLELFDSVLQLVRLCAIIADARRLQLVDVDMRGVQAASIRKMLGWAR